jgi:hypothetical protein
MMTRDAIFADLSGGLILRQRLVHYLFMLTGSIPSAEMGSAHRSFISTHQPDFLPDVSGPRALYRRKGYGHSIAGAA